MRANCSFILFSMVSVFALRVQAQTAEPISKVFGMGDLRSRWRSFVADDSSELPARARRVRASC